jgi:hypothetical protein
MNALYTPLYNVWRGMKQRCNNPNNKDYRNYGGKGVKVCQQWENNFGAFEIWALSNSYHKIIMKGRKAPPMQGLK